MAKVKRETVVACMTYSLCDNLLCDATTISKCFHTCLFLLEYCVQGEEVVTQDRLLESAEQLIESCSFTTNEGGDSPVQVSNISPFNSSGSVLTHLLLKGQLLGRGSFGSVYEGISGSEAQECIQQLEREIALLSRLQHQNIVRYRGSQGMGRTCTSFLELVSQGSLLKTYQRYQLPDSVVSTYTRQILDGLKYLHGEGFIHRDIKLCKYIGGHKRSC
ncbi:Mitogen-activated protein kinase kinase kinase 1 [Raphanus sativus]|nr:Mitogen-activated protein kinase kinase kinase 1 [Raphanus sativus]